jgi:hypothetical protein
MFEISYPPNYPRPWKPKSEWLAKELAEHPDLCIEVVDEGRLKEATPRFLAPIVEKLLTRYDESNHPSQP